MDSDISDTSRSCGNECSSETIFVGANELAVDCGMSIPGSDENPEIVKTPPIKIMQMAKTAPMAIKKRLIFIHFLRIKLYEILFNKIIKISQF